MEPQPWRCRSTSQSPLRQWFVLSACQQSTAFSAVSAHPQSRRHINLSDSIGQRLSCWNLRSNWNGGPSVVHSDLMDNTGVGHSDLFEKRWLVVDRDRLLRGLLTQQCVRVAMGNLSLYKQRAHLNGFWSKCAKRCTRATRG